MYQLAIIGGGPAGYTAAECAAESGCQVVLFEGASIGGVCLNEGCIPTKTLLYSAKRYTEARCADKYGVKAGEVSFDYSKIHQRKQKVVRKLQAGIRARLKDVTIVESEAIVVERTDEKVTLEAGGQRYEASNLLICTGSTNVMPPIDGLVDSACVWTSTDALNAKELPQSIVIVGGGVIGMEFATIFCELGVSVTVVEYMPQILPNIDEEIVSLLRQSYEKKGVRFLCNSKVVKIDGNKTVLETVSDSDSESLVLESERILVCVGRRPNLRGLECLTDLEFEGRGIKVNEFMQTNLSNVYAAGDVTGKIMLAHVASRQAEVAVGRMLRQIPLQRIAYNAVPAVVYTHPEIAYVGLKESDCVGKDCVLPMQTEVRRLPMTYSGRFVAENEGETGLCKVVVDKKSQTILGVHIFGNPASEIIGAASAAVRFGYTLPEWRQVIMPHPTVSEILKECIMTSV